MSIGRTFRAARERSGLSQRQLAIFAGVSSSFVTRLERDNLNPTWGSLERLAEVLQVEPVLRLVPNREAVGEAGELARSSKPVDRLRRQPVNALAILSLFQSFRVPHVVAGSAAALLQGFPTPVNTLRVVVDGSDDSMKALGDLLLTQLLLFDEVEPEQLREFVQRSWGFNDGAVEITLAAVLPDAVEIELLPDFSVLVLPPEMLLEDEEVASILRITRMRSSGREQ